MGVNKATNVIAVLDGTGKLVTEAIIENKAAPMQDFIKSQRGALWVAFEERTCAAWLYDLMPPQSSMLIGSLMKNSDLMSKIQDFCL